MAINACFLLCLLIRDVILRLIWFFGPYQPVFANVCLDFYVIQNLYRKIYALYRRF